jgi:hypothetical protein
MVRIHWQGQALLVRRIVLGGAAADGGLGEALRHVAALGDVVVATDVAEPEKGDFWVACQPEKGWKELGPEQLGWASGPEAALALAILRNAAPAEEFVEAPFITPRAKDVRKRELVRTDSSH